MKNKKQNYTSLSSCDFCSSICSDFHSYVENLNQDLNLTLKKMYCHGDYEKCARFIIHSRVGEEHLPLDLFPNQEIRAHSIVQEVQKIYS